MRNCKSINLAIFVLAIFIIAATETHAKSCDLPLKIVELKTDKDITGIRITVKNVQNDEAGTPFEIVPKDGAVSLAAATHGDLYRFDLIKAGYKHTVEYKVAFCIEHGDGMLPLGFTMKKGDPKDLFSVYDIYTREQYDKTFAAAPAGDTSPSAAGNGGVSAKNPAGDKKAQEILNGKALRLPQPEYPRSARALRAVGQVKIQITVDENGDVISAVAASGHPLLQAASIDAARKAKFRPALVDGIPAKVTGLIVYNFHRTR